MEYENVHLLFTVICMANIFTEGSTLAYVWRRFQWRIIPLRWHMSDIFTEELHLYIGILSDIFTEHMLILFQV